MKISNIGKLERYFILNPTYHGEPNNEIDIQNAENLLNLKFNSSYKEIIKRFGGCFIGIDIHGLSNAPIQGNETVIDLTLLFRGIISEINQLQNYQSYLVIGDDGSGNSILISNKNDDIFIYYHDEQIMEKLFSSFDELVEKFVNFY